MKKLSLPPKKKKDKIILGFRRWILVACGILVLLAAVYGRIRFYNERNSSNNNSGNDLKVGGHDYALSKTLTPQFNVNGRTYWTSGNGHNIASNIPQDYKYIGKIQSQGNSYSKLGNFQSSFGCVGAEIYMDPCNPDAAYLLIKKGRPFYYRLFITQELVGYQIYYNGSLYKADDEIPANNGVPWKESSGYKCVGVVRSTDYTKVPSHDFETNFFNSLRRNVYASPLNKDVVYIEKKSCKTRNFLEFKKSPAK